MRHNESVFICYAREDQEHAWRLFSDLTRAGYSVWFDQTRLAPGGRWEVWIREAIQECRYFVILLSRHSITGGYVQEELRRALGRLETLRPSRIFLIPARLDDVAVEHPRLKELQWVDLFDSWEHGVNSILSAMSGARSSGSWRLGATAVTRVSVNPWFALDEAAGALAYQFASRISHKERAARSGGPFVVGVMGAAGLGKTTLCAAIAGILNRQDHQATHLKLDGFLHNRQARRDLGVCGYEPGGWRSELADACLDALIRCNQAVSVPTYLEDGTHGPPVHCEPSKMVILDGNYSVFGKTRRLLSLLVYAHSDLTTMRYLRFDRDTQKPLKRFNEDEEERVWNRELLPLERHVLPWSNEADLVIEVDGHRNRRFMWRR